MNNEIMKYNELEIGAYFVFCRDRLGGIYQKLEYSIKDYVSGKEYRKPKGDTKVERYYIWLLFQFFCLWYLSHF